MGSKKKSTTKSSGTATSTAPNWTLPGYQQAGQLLQQAIAMPRPDPYTGQFIAQMDPSRVAAQMAAYDQAAATSGSLGGQLQSYMDMLMQPRDAVGLQQEAIAASINPVFRQLQEQVLPGITNSALSSGAYTTDRALGVVPQQAIRDTSEEAARLAAQYGWEAFQADENRRLQLGQLLPQLASQIGLFSSAQGDLMGLGTQLGMQLGQGGIDEALAQHNYALQAPFEGLDIMGSLLQLLSGSYGTQTQKSQSKTVESTGGLGQVLQGAMGLASMAGGLGLFGPLGTAATAAMGSGGLGGGIAGPMNNVTPMASSIFAQPNMSPYRQPVYF